MPAMNKVEQILSSVPIEVPMNLLVTNILLTALFASVLAWFYARFGQSLSNREKLSRNFVLVSTTTALIITIVKSSLALSLGLVGALSIVRFRAAIKEPEELGYLFLAITLGLGFGANQGMITVISFLIILVILYLQSLFRGSFKKESLFINLKLAKNKKVDLSDLLECLTDNVSKLDLRRVEDTQKELHLGCMIELLDSEQLNELTKLLRKKYPKISLLLVDSSGIAR